MQRKKLSPLQNALLQMWQQCDLYLEHLEQQFKKTRDVKINNKITIILDLLRISGDPCIENSVTDNKHRYRIECIQHKMLGFDTVKNFNAFIGHFDGVRSELEARRDIVCKDFIDKIINIIRWVFSSIFNSVRGKDFIKSIDTIYSDIKNAAPRFFSSAKKQDRKFILPDNDHVFRVLLVGDPHVGKSAILRKFEQDAFTESYYPTTDVEGFNKKLVVDQSSVQISGYEYTPAAEKSKRGVNLRYANAFMVVYDVTHMDSFSHAENWIEKIRRDYPSDMPIMLIGNKCDLLSERKIWTEDVKEFAEQKNLMFYEVSAKEGINIEEVFAKLSRQLIEKKEELEEASCRI